MDKLHAAILARLDTYCGAFTPPCVTALRKQVDEHYAQWSGWSEMEYEDPADNPANYHAAQLRTIADTLGLDKEQA